MMNGVAKVGLEARPRIAVAATGVANVASVLAALGRTGAEAFLTTSPADIRAAPFAVLPGVGAFGPAMERLAASGLDRAFKDRVAAKLPTLGICLGMQLFCEGSEESPGIEGLGLVPAAVRRFAVELPLPQLGWNFVSAATRAAGGAPDDGAGPSLVEPGWAYFANSYRLGSAPPGFRAWTAFYGEGFVAALQGAMEHNASLLLCQFHPELSGPWGLALYRRWLDRSEHGSRGEAGTPDTVSPRRGTAAAGATALRIVPCLDLKNGRVVKGRRFEALADAGDPVELAARYEEEGADELAILDITATIEGRAASLEVLKRVRARLGIPIVMGGGIRSDEDAAAVIEAGADRVSINSAAVADPDLIDRLAARFGTQCVVLAIDAVESSVQGTGPESRKWRVVVEAGRRATELEPAAWAAEGAHRGAGEILLTSIDRDGTGEGFDLELIAAVARSSGLPVIASGGAAGGGEGLVHFAEAAVSGARAVLAAGAFHRGELRIDGVKRYLEERNIGVRL
ncbi:MAG: imidazole glycerol phosphate synthase subunit HisH [Rectinemataceae bacterium]